MGARGASTTWAAALVALGSAACGGGAPEPVAPAAPIGEAPVAVIEVPRVAKAKPPRGASAPAPAESATPRQAEPREDTTSRITETKGARASSEILVPCSPSDPGCGVLGVLGSSGSSATFGSGGSATLGTAGGGPGLGGIGIGGGGVGGPIGLGNLGNPAGATPRIRIPAKPTGNAEIVSQSTSSPISNAAAVVAGMRPGFRRCYNRGLTQDPSLQGLVAVRLEVAADGGVTRATATSSKALDAIRGCIESRGSSSQFAPPDSGKAATVFIRVKLSPPPPPDSTP